MHPMPIVGLLSSLMCNTMLRPQNLDETVARKKVDKGLVDFVASRSLGGSFTARNSTRTHRSYKRTHLSRDRRNR
jgi:hypothetical protein